MIREQEQGLLEALQKVVISGDTQKAEQLAKKAIKEGIDPLLALEDGVGKGIRTVGAAFGKGEAFLPELIGASDAMQAATKMFVEELKSRGIKKKAMGTVVIGTASGDIHDIGKTLVATLLVVNGFEVYDLGINLSPEKFVEAVRQYQPDIVGISALLSITMVGQREVLKALSEANLRSQVKVMVGGAPVTAEWAEEIGADAYGMNAFEAVTKAKALIGLNH